MFLVDTNVLLRSVQPSHAMHASAERALRILLSRGEDLAITVQNIAEFWNVSTRPANQNGLGFTPDETAEVIAQFERYFEVLTESALSYAVLRSLLRKNMVTGVQVHDARLVSIMQVHSILQILTFNVKDFARYSEVEAIHPDSVSD